MNFGCPAGTSSVTDSPVDCAGAAAASGIVIRYRPPGGSLTTKRPFAVDPDAPGPLAASAGPPGFAPGEAAGGFFSPCAARTGPALATAISPQRLAASR